MKTPSVLMPSFRLRTHLRFAIILLSTAGLNLAAGTQPNGQWKAVSPGFSPQVLRYHENAMWAAGEGGSIAVSTDGGEHWIQKHADSADGTLLALNFTNAKFGYAAGTGAHLLMTSDGGKTWSVRAQTDAAIYQAAFGDPQHGVVRTRTGLLATIDGGRHWSPVSPGNDPDWVNKYPNTKSMTALDATHMLVRVGGAMYGDGEFLWSADGGATWSANYLPNGAGGGPVFVVDGSYWSIGGEVVGKDHPGGGLNVPMAIRSSDGVQWDHLPANNEACHWEGCGGCTPQGCFAGRSSFVGFSNVLEGASAATNSLARIPEHRLSPQWVRTGNTLCLLTQGGIECAPMTPVSTLDTRDDPAEWESLDFPPLREDRPSLAQAGIGPLLRPGVYCIRCDLVRMQFTEMGSSGPVAIQVSFKIETNGRVTHVKVNGDLPKDVRAKLQGAAEGWLFEPYMDKGKPKAINEDIREAILLMNPQKPPHGASN
jgi:hypothetical protein